MDGRREHIVSLSPGNRDFLGGDPAWWNRESLPDRFEWERPLPEGWPRGWRRQRLQPALAGLVIPGAWSVALLLAFWIPVLIGDLDSNEQTVVSILLGLHFLLLIIPLLRDAGRVEHGDAVRALRWLVTRPPFLAQLILSALGVAMMQMGDLGIMALPLVGMAAILWWVILREIANALAYHPGRWLLPIAHVDIGLESLPEGWRMVARRFGRRPLAEADLGGGWRLVLYGMQHAGIAFVALWLAHPCGRLIDPFSEPQLIGQPSRRHLARALRGLATPPVEPIRGAWPASMGEEE